MNLLLAVIVLAAPPKDAVEVKTEKVATYFIVKSATGIGKTVIERPGDEWPKTAVLRLHLKGLESFNVLHGNVKIEAAVAIREGKPQVRIWKDGKENDLLDEKSPFWLDIRILDAEGKPAKELPLKDGFFEIVLPMALFEDKPKTISLNWIDFYR